MTSQIISSADAERLAEGLRTFELSEIGSKAWLAQHKTLEQMNLQAHASAQSDSDNYVVEALLTFEKFPIILHSLLATEAWLDYLLPKLSEDLFGVSVGGGAVGGGGGGGAAAVATRSTRLPNTSVQRAYAMRIYFVIYHEATLANMLECMLYHDYAAQAFGDSVIELVDYCARKIAYLVRTGPEAVSEEEALSRRLAKIRMEEHELTEASSAGDGEAKGSPKAIDAERLAALKKEAKEILAKIGGAEAAAAASKKGGRGALTPAEDIRGHLRTLGYRSAVSAVVVSRYLSEHLTSLPLSAMARFLDTHDFLVLSVPLIEVCFVLPPSPLSRRCFFLCSR